MKKVGEESTQIANNVLKYKASGKDIIYNDLDFYAIKGIDEKELLMSDYAKVDSVGSEFIAIDDENYMCIDNVSIPFLCYNFSDYK